MLNKNKIEAINLQSEGAQELKDEDLQAIVGAGSTTTVTVYRRNGSIRRQSTTVVD